MPYYGFGYSPEYLFIVLVSLVLGLATQSYIKSTYKKWSRIPLRTGQTGAEVARHMLDSQGASAVGITSVSGHLTDFYDPRDNMLHLSSENQHDSSIASAAVACHEAGHAIQAAQGYIPLKIRHALVPVVNFTSNFWMILFMIGIFIQQSGLVTLGIYFFAFSVLFQLVTLPVEIDASRRAVAYISQGLSDEAKKGARQVLTAAALTYVAAALVSVLQLLYLLGISSNDRN